MTSKFITDPQDPWDGFLSTSGAEFYGSFAGTGPELKYAGSPVAAGQFGTWTPIRAEQTASGYEVAWKVNGAETYGIWNTDNNGNWVSSPAGGLSGTGATLENFENSFQQDLNHDGVIGVPNTLIESAGAISLVQVNNNYFLFANGTNNGPSLKYAGTPFTAGQFGAVSPIGAEQTASGYEVAWKVDGADTYGIWNTDTNGNYVSSPAGGLAGASATLENFETSFQQDLNHDGVIGVPPGGHVAMGWIV